MNQRQMEKEIWQFLGAYLDGMSFEEAAESACIEPKSVSEGARFIRARDFVANQIWRRSGAVTAAAATVPGEGDAQ